jgi:hypothetical protein
MEQIACMSNNLFLNSSYAKRYAKVVVIAIPIIFGMTYLPSKLSGESIKQYARSHPKSISERIGFAVLFSLIIAAPLALQSKPDVSKRT